MAATPARVAVIIPSYGDPAGLFRTLASLEAQQQAPTDLGPARPGCRPVVQVVHSGPVPLPPREQWPPLTLDWRLEDVGPRRLSAAEARNLAVSLTDAELLVFLDSNCLAGRHFLAGHLDAHGRGSTVVSGAVLPCPDESAVALAEYLVEFATTRLRRPGGAMSAPACNLSMRRSLFESVGGFPGLEAGEDVLLNLRLRQGGHQLSLHPWACVHHRGRQTIGPYRHHRRFIGAGLGQLTALAEREGLFNAGISAEYHMLRLICRSPQGVLLVVAKLFRLLVLVLQGDRLVLRTLLNHPVLILDGLWAEARACRRAFRQEQGMHG